MKALVTGGAGFIGSHIVDLLLLEGHDVAIVDDMSTGTRTNVHGQARLHEIDIISPTLSLVFETERPEVVFHQAAQMSVKVSTDAPVLDARINVVGLIRVLQACVNYGVRKIVYASSGAIYGNPDYLPFDEDHPQRPASPYGITKLMGEHYLRYFAQDHGLQYTALRYGNVYGPRQRADGEAGVIAIFARQLLTGQTPTIHWDGEQTRDYVYVADVARANLLAASRGDGRIYCIGTGIGTSVNQLYRALCEVIGVNVPAHRAPRRAGDLRAAYFDTRRAQDELGWRATIPLGQGLTDTVASWRREPLIQPRALVGE